MFNRLIFREIRKASYFSEEKKPIYERNEWVFVTFFFLIFLGFIAPVAGSYAIGGMKYVFVFLAVFCFTSWDLIFGRIVFDDWFGDIPSMKVPVRGWIHTPLKQNLCVRGALGALCVLILLIFY
jgi:hypothetical protein